MCVLFARCTKMAFDLFRLLIRHYFMPSVHEPSFCCKELREKGGEKVRFFSRTESAHTTDFLSQAALRKNRTDFFSDQKSAHTDQFLSELLCVTIIGEVPLLDDVTLIFSRTEVSAHVNNSEKRS